MTQQVTESIPPKLIKTTEELSCELNQVEWQNRAQDLADAQKAAEETEERKKSITADLNADLKTAKLKVSKLARVVANRRELREVTVEVKYDYDLGVVTKTRTDTNEEISRRDMTTEERQSELDLVDANKFIESRHSADKGVDDGLEQTADSEEEAAEKEDI